MKLNSRNSARSRGSTLALTLIFSGLLAFVLMAYLYLVKVQNYSTMRSQAWNVAISTIEAGIEDALTHLNTHGLTNLQCDGWERSGSIYWVLRPMGDGYYFATISNYNAGTSGGSPIIESRALVRMPAQLSSLPQAVMASMWTSDSANSYLARGVKLTTRGDFLFSKGLVAKGRIDLNGNSIQTDSFDSSDPVYSSGGRYDLTKRKDNGDVATNMTLTNSLNVGNANIRGRVSTGPKGTVQIGASGVVGDAAWHASGQQGIKPGWSRDDMNVDFRDVEMPFTSGAQTPGSGTVNGIYYDYVLQDGNYALDAVETSDCKIIALGKANLLVRNTLKISGQGSIIVTSNATLKLYVKAASAQLGGNGVINRTGNATNFYYYGLPSNRSLSIDGNGGFTGVVYAPSADFTLNGGGSDYQDFIGSSITQSAVMNGKFRFHYDESLGKSGPFRGYIVTSWNEMTPKEVAQLPVSVEF